MTKQDLDEETEMLKRAARQMFGEQIVLTPHVIEIIRNIYRTRMGFEECNHAA